MNGLMLAGIIILALNVILLLFLLVRSRHPLVYIVRLAPEPLSKPIITPDELREIAWESWCSAHPDASPLEQSQAQWIIEKEAHRLERRNRQRHPFAGSQKKPR